MIEVQDKRNGNRLAWRARMLALGLCPVCGKNPLVTKNHCEECRRRHNRHSTETKRRTAIKSLSHIHPRPHQLTEGLEGVFSHVLAIVQMGFENELSPVLFDEAVQAMYGILEFAYRDDLIARIRRVWHDKERAMRLLGRIRMELFHE